MNLTEKIRKYEPKIEQEIADKNLMLEYLNNFDNCLKRENKFGHFTASAFVINKEHTKMLMAYHNIYDSWSWLGGHADGEEDLLEVAIKEVKEESSVKNVKVLSDDIYSLEALTVDSHIKRGEFISSHIHLNVTYILEADENEELCIKEDENSGVKWVKFEDVVSLSNEKNMKIIYKKLIDKFYEN